MILQAQLRNGGLNLTEHIAAVSQRFHGIIAGYHKAGLRDFSNDVHPRLFNKFLHPLASGKSSNKENDPPPLEAEANFRKIAHRRGKALWIHSGRYDS